MKDLRKQVHMLQGWSKEKCSSLYVRLQLLRIDFNSRNNSMTKSVADT